LATHRIKIQKDHLIFGQFQTKIVTVPGGRTAIDNDPADKGGKSPCNGKLESFTANGRNIRLLHVLM
jgi:hypothetical protein